MSTVMSTVRNALNRLRDRARHSLWLAGLWRRLMWRTTVHGNPGTAYAGEAKSWLPRP